MSRLRFAPSPTGYLHIGNARTALFNWLHARRFGGKFVLRIEDTDTERSRHEYVLQIIADLRWLGMDWDEGPDVGGLYGPYRQSERLSVYREHLARLVARGLAYKCYCTAEELDQRRSAAMAAGRSPAYDNRCRALIAADIARFETEGRRPSYRFKVSGEKVVFNDLIHGHTEFDTSGLGDFVVMKSDAWPTYHFAVVVDDALMKITHVLRGVGHLPNTALHILLFAALGYDIPQFAHMSLTHGADGHVLSKRHGAVARPYLSYMAQITEHVGYFRTRPALTPEARAHVASAEAQGVLRRVAEKLKEAGPLSGESFTALVRAVQAETQVKGKALYIPLRLALTGREHGPELHLIAPILGAVECRERIEAVLDPHRKPE